MIRLDRFITVFLGHPFGRAFQNRRQAQIPILMYHGIRERLDGRHPYYETATTPAVFAAHMKFLHDEGFKVVDLFEASKWLASNDAVASDFAASNSSLRALHSSLVVLTFDDGYRDFYAHAFPVLREHNFTATLFLPTSRIANERINFEGNDYLTWPEVRELYSNGVAIGSHTVTHPELVKLGEPEIDRELGDSKRTIEDKLGAAVRSFAYPYAFPESNREFTKMLETLLQKHGYENGVTTIIGGSSARSPRYFLPRLPVNNWDDARLFRAKLEGGYDWLHWPQLLFKAAGAAVHHRRSSRSEISAAVNEHV